MSDEKKNTGDTYSVGTNNAGAIGKNARVTNINSNIASQIGVGQPIEGPISVDELFGQLIARVKEEAKPLKQKSLVPELEAAKEEAKKLEKNADDEEAKSFLEQRLYNIYNMSEDIAQVLILTLANPVAGMAAVIQKIAEKAMKELELSKADDDTGEAQVSG